MPRFEAQLEGPPYGGPSPHDLARISNAGKKLPEPFAAEMRILHAQALSHQRRALQAQQALRFVYAKWRAKQLGVAIDASKVPF